MLYHYQGAEGPPNRLAMVSSSHKRNAPRPLVFSSTPNFPPVPKITTAAAVCTPCQDQEQLTTKVLTMLGIPTKTPQPLPQQRTRNPIKITPPPHRQQNFQTAHNVPTNIAASGPPVAEILSSIMAMDANQRQALSEGLTNAGF